MREAVSEGSPILAVSGYASVDYALQLAPFQGFDATTIVRSRADEWPRYGGIAHVTRAAARAGSGVRVAALSWVGDDAEGRAWTAAVAAAGADVSAVAVSGQRSPSSHLLYPEGAGAICLFDPGDCHDGGLAPAQRELLAAADAVVVTIGPADATREMLETIPEGCRVFWILKQDPSSLTEGLADELSARAGVITLSEGERGYLDGILRRARPGAFVVVTRGSRGADLFRVSPQRELEAAGGVPASPVEGVDTTGAGDTFSGTLAALVASGPDPEPEEMLAHIGRASEATARILAERAPRDSTDHRETHEENAR